MNRSIVALVGCGAQKVDERTYAHSLYRGDLFRKASSYAELVTPDWYILSAKHGLLNPQAVINPYDMHLGELSRQEQINWGKQVADDLRQHLLGSYRDPREDVELLWLAGATYTGLVLPHMEKWGYHYHRAPLAHRGIGEQKQWLKRQIADATTVRAMLSRLEPQPYA